MNVTYLREHEYSYDKGLLNAMEKRQRVKKDLNTRNRSKPYDMCLYIVENCGRFNVSDEEADLSRNQIVFASASMIST